MWRPRVVCWGELVWDVFPDGPRLGGALANVAWHVARLGGDAVLVTRVGDDELGRAALERLAKGGVDVRFVQVDGARPTGTVNVTIVDGEPRYRIGEQAAWDALALTDDLRAELGRVDAIVYGTLAQRTALGRGALSDALPLVSGIKVCDLNLRPPHDTIEVVEGALASADVVKLNRGEALRVGAILAAAGAVGDVALGADATDVTPVLAALAVGGGARRAVKVALTRGADGAMWADGRVRSFHPGVPAAPGGDAVGCGDAFTAVLTLGLLAKQPAGRVIGQACAYASYVAGVQGGMPDVPEAVARAARPG